MANNIVTICPECNVGSLRVHPVTLSGSRGGEQFSVTIEGVLCDNCDYKTVTNTQSGAFTRAISDAYRTHHGLLTGEEIRDLRDRLGMNQVDFADYLGVGSASVKRWESGQVQDKAMDNLIRLKAQPEQALHNYQALEEMLPDHHSIPVIVFIDEDVELSTYSEMTYRAQRMDWNMEDLDTDQLAQEPVAA